MDARSRSEVPSEGGHAGGTKSPPATRRSRVEALRDVLREGAQGGFAGLAGAVDFGSRLRVACDRVLSTADDAAAQKLVEWRAELADFEGLERDAQAVLVARGLRLCFGMEGRRGATPVARGRREADREAPVPVAPLKAPTTSLPGIGPALAEKLSEKGLSSVEDLCWLVPRRYDDARNVASLAEAIEQIDGDARAFAAIVTSSRFVRSGRRRWVEVKIANSSSESGSESGSASGSVAGSASASATVRWFHAHGGMAARFPVGAKVTFSGKLGKRGGVVEIANPDVLEVVTPDGTARRAPGRIIPRYADVPGVAPGIVRRTCAAAVERAAGIIDDGVPDEVSRRMKLPRLDDTLAALHRPADTLPDDEVEALTRGDSIWHRRLAFGDLFLLGVAVALRRRDRCSDRAVPCAADTRGQLAAALPFRLTGAQERAIAAIAADLARPVPMNRLLQGDVGAGKTAVALAAAHQVAASGRQTAIMAPTEILAEQHMTALTPLCRTLGVKTALVTAATPRGVRASTASLLAAGQIDIVIGTHALLAGDLAFAALGLCIIDEQHRFGVAQRVKLRGKGDADGAPHLLVMTATPIPRTLALSAYGDLDLALLDEMPPGRAPPETRVLSGARGRQQANRAIETTLAGGARAFVVCPLIAPAVEEEDAIPWVDATTRAEELERDLGPGVVGLVHGRMSQAERDDVMVRFRDGSLRVLVATTVIEVGIDIPSATLMIVEDADRFGLAQLHQLRGRVGRGGGASKCLLLTRGNRSQTAAQRLAIMESTCDGFKIAEEDLVMRGPGELIGVRQAGLPRLRFGDLVQHVELLARAREEAERVIESDPQLALPEHLGLRRVLAARMAEIEAYGAESG